MKKIVNGLRPFILSGLCLLATTGIVPAQEFKKITPYDNSYVQQEALSDMGSVFYKAYYDTQKNNFTLEYRTFADLKNVDTTTICREYTITYLVTPSSAKLSEMKQSIQTIDPETREIKTITLSPPPGTIPEKRRNHPASLPIRYRGIDRWKGAKDPSQIQEGLDVIYFFMVGDDLKRSSPLRYYSLIEIPTYTATETEKKNVVGIKTTLSLECEDGSNSVPLWVIAQPFIQRNERKTRLMATIGPFRIPTKQNAKSLEQTENDR